MQWQLFAFVGLFVAWVAFAATCIYLDAKLGGWQTLAAQYGRSTKPAIHGRVLWPAKIVLAHGASEYSGGLVTVTATPGGIGLKVLFPLRFLYPELFLPWKDATVHRERGWLWDRVHLTFSKVPDVPVTISSDLAQRILNAIGPVWIETPAAK
jgi:hypothetical protein